MATPRQIVSTIAGTTQLRLNREHADAEAVTQTQMETARQIAWTFVRTTQLRPSREHVDAVFRMTTWMAMVASIALIRVPAIPTRWLQGFVAAESPTSIPTLMAH